MYGRGNISLFVELSEDVLLAIHPFLPENCSWFKAKIISGMQFGRKKEKSFVFLKILIGEDSIEVILKRQRQHDCLKHMCNHTVTVVGNQLDACQSDRVYMTEPKLEQWLWDGEKYPC